MFLDKGIDKKIGDRLATARQVRGMSQTKVAKILHVSHVTVATLEDGGRSLRACEVTKFASLYGVDPVWLMFGDSREDHVDPELIKRLQLLTPFERQVVIRKLTMMGE